MQEVEIALFFIGAAALVFFSFAETSLLTLGQWRLRELMLRAPDKGVLAQRLLVSPQDLIATISLANTICQGVLMAMGMLLVMDNAGFEIRIVATLVCALLICEVFPKTMAIRNPVFWTARVVWLMSWLVYLCAPLRALVQKVNGVILRLASSFVANPRTHISDEEYQELLEMACQHGAMMDAEKEIIMRILSLDRRRVAEVMRPRAQVACIPDDLSIADMVAESRRHKHRVLPMYDETPDVIVGILDVPRFLANPNEDLADFISFPAFVSEEMNLQELVRSFQKHKQSMAVVLDEFGGMAGIVTREDIVAELIGQGRRGGSRTQLVMEQIGEKSWRLSGGIGMDDFRRLHTNLPKLDGVDTVAGLALYVCGEVPVVGTQCRFDGLKITVTEADARLIKEVRIEIDGKGTDR